MKAEKTTCDCHIEGSRRYKRMDEVEKFLLIISDRIRLRILCLLKNKEMNVKSIYKEIGIKQTLASHHLAQLKKLALLKERKRGTSSYYRVDTKRMEKYCNLLGEIVELELKNKKSCK